jgi:hypothetical protein
VGASVALVVAGAALQYWVNRGTPEAASELAQSTFVGLAPLIGYWLLMYGIYFVRAMKGIPRTSFLLRLTDGEIVEANGWRVRIRMVSSGLSFAPGLLDSSQGWPIEAAWVVVDPHGKHHTAIVRTQIAIATPIMESAQRAWPADFHGEWLMGPYRVEWVVGGRTVVEREFELRRPTWRQRKEESASAGRLDQEPSLGER